MVNRKSRKQHKDSGRETKKGQKWFNRGLFENAYLTSLKKFHLFCWRSKKEFRVDQIYACTRTHSLIVTLVLFHSPDFQPLTLLSVIISPADELKTALVRPVCGPDRLPGDWAPLECQSLLINTVSRLWDCDKTVSVWQLSNCPQK